MLSSEERNKKIKSTAHIFQAVKERRHLFPSHYKVEECIAECYYAIRNHNKGIIIPDERPGVQSKYTCIFIGDSGKVIAIPLTFSDGFIVPLTIKDVRSDFNNPNWCVNKYNEIATKRGMQPLPHILK